MRKLITILLIFLAFQGNATTYYISNSGSISNSGTSSAAPWPFSKVSSTVFAPGDNILFNRGETFYGSITINASGNSTSPITYGAYGTGAAPVITGFTTVSSWASIGTNIWESTSAISSLTSCNSVLVNGTLTAMGRWPNSTYAPYQSHNTSTSLTSSSLTGTPNWTGAHVCMKRQRWYIEDDTITSQSGSTINFTDKGKYTLQDNYGFFIQNDSLTLDSLNEWYFNPSTKKLRIYSPTSPTSVQVSTVDKLVTNPSNYTYIKIENISFTGSNTYLIDFNFGGHETINNCTFSYAGSTSIHINGTTDTITNNAISNSGYTGIWLEQNCVNSYIYKDTITRTYPIAGSLDDGSGGSAIYTVGASSEVRKNKVDSSGWGGINVYGNNSIADSNFVNHFGLLRDDCGGVATHHGYTGVQFYDNMVLNGIGNRDGVSSSDPNMLAHGIYLDDLSTFVTVLRNTAEGCSGVGMMNHRSHDITVTGNTFYNNNYSQSNFTRGQMFFQYTDTPAFKNYQIKNNILFAANSNQSIWNQYASPANIQSLNAFGTEDSNYYVTTASGNLFFTNNGGTVNNYTLPGWQTYTSGDAHSVANIFTGTQLFLYNTTSSDSTFSLGYTYQDAKGNQYNNGSVTLHPYTSIVLIKMGSLGFHGPFGLHCNCSFNGIKAK